MAPALEYLTRSATHISDGDSASSRTAIVSDGLTPTPRSKDALGVFDKSSVHLSGYESAQLAPRGVDSIPNPLHARATTPKYRPGSGAIPPERFNNRGFFALFAILGVAMVIASIWFFFFAKNGGFVFRKGDWEDYKSTVLRRKGKDGKTLSNATKTTKLGMQSVAGTFEPYRMGRAEKEEMLRGYRDDDGRRSPKKQKVKGGIDADVRAYRHEKPARVGGMNREADGSHYSFASYDRSEAMTADSLEPILKQNQRTSPTKKKDEKPKEKKIGFMEKNRGKKVEKAAAKNNMKAAKAALDDLKRGRPSPKKYDYDDDVTAYTGEEEISTTYTESSPYVQKKAQRRSSYYDSYRPQRAERSSSAHRKPSYADAYRPASRERQQQQARQQQQPQQQQHHQRRSSARASASQTRRAGTSGARPHSRPSSPRKQRAHRMPGTFDYGDDISEAAYLSDAGTKAYAKEDLRGRAPAKEWGGGRNVMAGYRRGGFGGRRDSLSDSDGESGSYL